MEKRLVNSPANIEIIPKSFAYIAKELVFYQANSLDDKFWILFIGMEWYHQQDRCKYYFCYESCHRKPQYFF